MPWVVRDFVSSELDFSSDVTYRDLSKPLGAQTEARLARFVEKVQKKVILHE
jgi:hypothetical protein